MNKIIELFNNKEDLYRALNAGDSVQCTTNLRTAPNAFTSTCGTYTIGINPKDESYFDFEIKKVTDIINSSDVAMIKDFLNKKGYDKSKKAFESCFKDVIRQYSFEDIISIKI